MHLLSSWLQSDEDGDASYPSQHTHNFSRRVLFGTLLDVHAVDGQPNVAVHSSRSFHLNVCHVSAPFNHCGGVAAREL